MRILLLSPHYGRGGAEKVLYDQAIFLSRECYVEEAVFDFSVGERFYNTGFTAHRLDRKGLWSKLGAAGRLVSRCLQLRSLVKQKRYDVVISHMDGANWVNILSFSSAKKFLVVHGTILHDRNISKLLQFFRIRVIFPFLYNLANRSVGVSGGITQELISCGVKNSVALQNTFDVDGILSLSTFGVDEKLEPIFIGAITLVTSGRLARQKNQASLIDIVCELRMRGVPARLVILGDGELRSFLLDVAKRRGLRVYDIWDDSPQNMDVDFEVCFLGHVSNPYAYLVRSDIFLFPSSWEGFPLALCEAMICGLPIVSSDCPTGPREILSSPYDDASLCDTNFQVVGNGILAPIPGDELVNRAWVNAILELLGNALLRERLAASAKDAGLAMDHSEGLRKWMQILRE
ncbi:glycosyltransferase [Thioclava sp. F28-4]|uniref:glycosyltransferase n=1 Tax=Thioclava sp. F28-4 TaxID=1915315 RepID=UPI0009960FCD|nr:glycosyltransferase [Thioclava sp. F28-4]OOY04243.1 hypothetical protein BMI87_11845 [Thioclava sp. F28-4]